jgi:hypothetical protein
MDQEKREDAQIRRQQRECKGKLEAESRTRALYEQAAYLIVEGREMFAMPLQERLQQPTKGLLAWVAQVTPSVKVGLLEAQSRIRANIRDIRKLFRPIT